MWLIISTPSKPASLMAFIFSATDPFMPTVAHMMAFLIDRLDPSSAETRIGAERIGAIIAVAVAAAPLFKNSRRFMIALNEFRLSRHGDGRDGHRRIPCHVFWNQPFLRVQRLFPGDFLPGIGGHASHERDQRALGHPRAIIDRFAFPNAGEEFVMLVLVHV